MGGQKKHSKNKNNNKAKNTNANFNTKLSKQEQQNEATSSTSATNDAGKQQSLQSLEHSVEKLRISKRSFISPQKRNELANIVDNLKTLGFKMTVSPKEQWDLYKKMQELLNKAMAIEECLNPFREPIPEAKRLEKIEVFYKWAKENGLESEGIEVAEFPGYGLGLKAKRDIENEEEIFAVPHKLILNERSVRNVLNMGTMSNVNLSYAVMLEYLKPDSFWKPYIDLLPTEYNTCLYYTEEEMEMLKGSNLLPSVLNQCKSIARQYAVFYNLIHNMEIPTKSNPSASLLKERFCYALYRWAVSTVMTRQNFVPDIVENPQTETPLSALIPFWDFANHKRGKITTFYYAKDNKMISSAQQRYKEDEQIFIHYGERSNSEFLLHNGFIEENNPNDFVGIRLGLSLSDPLHNKRKNLLEMLKIAVNDELKVLPGPTYISSELLAYVRIFNMNEDQLDHWISSGRPNDLLHIDCALETDLENRTWKYIETRLSLLMRLFSSSLEEDDRDLANYNNGLLSLSPTSVLLLKYRIVEKCILKGAYEYAKQRTKA